MIKTSVYLDSEVALALRQLARIQRRSQAELIREAVSIYTRPAAQPTPKGIGRYHSGRSDVSQRAEELLGKALKHRR